MIVLFDNLKFQNDTHMGGKGPIVAEVGVLVLDIPSDHYSEEEGWTYIDVPLNIEPGYYYVAMISKTESVGGVGSEDWGKKYLVSKESIYEYVYGFGDENEPPVYIETYDRIADAVDSVFLNYFLLMNQLIDVSRHDQAEMIYERRSKKLASKIETDIQIDKIDSIHIISRACTTDDEKLLSCEIVIDESGNCGVAFTINNGDPHLFPACMYVVSDKNGNTEKVYYTLDRAYDSPYFACFVEMKKATEEKLCAFFEQEDYSLKERFSEKEIAALKTGILGAAMGMKEYQ